MIYRIFYLYFFISLISCLNNYNDDYNVNLLRWLSNAARSARAAQNTTSNATTAAATTTTTTTAATTTTTNNSSEIINNIDVNQSAIINPRNAIRSDSISNSIRSLLEVLEQNAQNILQTINEMNNIVDDQEKELGEMKEEKNEQEQQEETSSAPSNSENDKNCETVETTEPKGSTNHHTNENCHCDDCVENNNDNGIDLFEQHKKLKIWNKQIAICKELLKNAKSVLPSNSNGDNDNDGENVDNGSSKGDNSGSNDDNTKNEVIVPNVAILSPLRRKLFKISTPSEEQNLQNKSESSSNSNAAPITNPGWTEWTEWTPCSVSCGIGKRIRFRKCSGPSCKADIEIDEKACHYEVDCGRTFKFN